MAPNPYETLGIKKDASEAEIKAAYRKLAKKNHPDLNPGDTTAKQRFADISSANDLLSDKDKRAAFDRGEIDASGQPRQQQPFYRDYAGTEGTQRYRQSGGFGGQAPGGGFESSSFSEIFESMFGGKRAAQQAAPASDAHYSIEIDFLEAAKGASKRVTMPDGAALDIIIPPGVSEGQQLRLKGKGHASRNGDVVGDAYVELHIRPHDMFARDGNNITIELPVGFHESILGAKVSVPTIHGPVSMAIPKGATTGQTLRLKGKGIKSGDQFVRLKIVMPKVIDPELEKLAGDWAKAHPWDPRGKGGA